MPKPIKMSFMKTPSKSVPPTDKYAESAKGKKGTAGVDAAFLAEIDSWRQALAQNIALRNPKLTQRELNFAVGKTIDRIIFLRICEDRGIEPYGQLMAMQNRVSYMSVAINPFVWGGANEASHHSGSRWFRARSSG